MSPETMSSNNVYRVLTILLAVVVIAACSQQSSAPTGSVNNGLVLGIGEIPMGVTNADLETQALDAVFNGRNPADGADIDFSVDAPSDIIFDDVNRVNYIRTRVRITNNTGAAITNLTLMGIAPLQSTLTTLSNLRDLVGNPLSQVEAFNADSAVDPTVADPNFIPSPTHAVEINDQGVVEIIETRADFVAYEEDPTAGTNRVGTNELQPIINELNTIAANDPSFGLTGTDGTDFSLLPFGFQVGSLADGADGFVDVTFSIPNDPDGVGVSPLARFSVTFIAVQDTTGRVTEAVEEIDLNGNLDSGVGDSEIRFLNPAAAQSDLQNVTSLALLGSAERDLTVPDTSVVCIPNVRIGFGDANGVTIFDTAQTDATAGDCTLNDASAFALAIDNALGDQEAGVAFTDNDPPLPDAGGPVTLTLTDGGNPVEGREITVELTGAPMGVPLAFDAGTLSGTTDANGQVTFTDLVINTVGTGFEATFASGSILPIVEVFDVLPGPFNTYEFMFFSGAGEEPDAIFPPVFTTVSRISADADPNTPGIQPTTLTIRGVDQFGNEVDLDTPQKQVYIDVVLLQNGTPVAGNPIVGISGINISSDTPPYPELDLTANPPVTPFRIEFASIASNPGAFFFSGVGVVPVVNDNTRG
ncbi:MAG: hypothetical protein AAF267_22755, partial [Deinococcota bacterium]